MTDKELQKLRRTDLLELLLAQTKENERLNQLLAQANEQLLSRQIAMDKAGSIAEAALQLNGVFEAAQAAAEQYMVNIRGLSERQEEVCARMEEETRKKCAEMVAQAERDSKAYWDSINSRLAQLLGTHKELQGLLGASKGN